MISLRNQGRELSHWVKLKEATTVTHSSGIGATTEGVDEGNKLGSFERKGTDKLATALFNGTAP
eukprot:1139918-Pelagomonas_calceolata.AAC.5